MKTGDTLLDEASRLRAADTNLKRAEHLYREVMARADGVLWGTAAVELVDMLHCDGQLEEAVSLARQILDAPDHLALPGSRARAGVHLVRISNWLGVPIAPLIDLLARSARACVQYGDEGWGAVGIAQLGYYLFLQGPKTPA
ncbi:MAG: hypothetical protein ABI867_29405 [Kofleriaceae bacterium]